MGVGRLPALLLSLTGHLYSLGTAVTRTHRLIKPRSSRDHDYAGADSSHDHDPWQLEQHCIVTLDNGISEYIHQDNTTMLSALWWSGLNCTLRPYYGRHKIKSPSTNQQSQLFVQSKAAYESGEVQPAGVKASVERQLERSMSGAQLAPVWCLEYRAF